LEDRFISTQFGTFTKAEWTGKNTSGMRAYCDKVLVLPDQAVRITAGGIHIPDDSQENQTMAATSGVLVSVGPQAFAYDSNRLVHWVGERPKPGDRVFFMKYAGQMHQGRDGLSYRFMEDRSIAGGLDPEGTE